MRRRDFVAYGSAAVAAGALGSSSIIQDAEAQVAAGFTFELHLEEIYEEMIDGEVYFALAPRNPLTRALRPVLTVVEGARVTLKVTNKTRKARRLGITGFADTYLSPVAAGASAQLSFIAPPAGSYLYHDCSEGAVGRVAGLHGALIVLPADGRTRAGTHTPYTTPSNAQARLFDALGSGRFPGQKWRGDLPERNKVWVFGSMDPALQQMLEQNKPVDPATFIRTFRPRYFTINGLSGYDSAHEKTIAPRGYIGEPVLIRSINAGLATHSPHIHGNHVFRLADTGANGGVVKCECVVETDSWMIKPLWRIDLLLPFIKPDDIPAKAWPPKQERFPLRYPMHCHMEMSQTAGGGNYPQGLITDWELLGVSRSATT